MLRRRSSTRSLSLYINSGELIGTNVNGRNGEMNLLTGKTLAPDFAGIGSISHPGNWAVRGLQVILRWTRSRQWQRQYTIYTILGMIALTTHLGRQFRLPDCRSGYKRSLDQLRRICPSLTIPDSPCKVASRERESDCKCPDGSPCLDLGPTEAQCPPKDLPRCEDMMAMVKKECPSWPAVTRNVYRSGVG